MLANLTWPTLIHTLIVCLIMGSMVGGDSDDESCNEIDYDTYWHDDYTDNLFTLSTVNNARWPQEEALEATIALDKRRAQRPGKAAARTQENKALYPYTNKVAWPRQNIALHPLGKVVKQKTENKAPHPYANNVLGPKQSAIPLPPRVIPKTVIHQTDNHSFCVYRM